MAGKQEAASLSAKLFGLLYYCSSSISVQLVNKARTYHAHHAVGRYCMAWHAWRYACRAGEAAR